jgi:hypothetical protein
MTDIARQGGPLQVIRLPGNRATVTGSPGRVAVALDLFRRDGQLVSATDPVPTADGGVLVTVKLLPAVPAPPAPAPRPASRWTPRTVVALAAVIGAVLVSCGALGLRGLAMAGAWVGAHGTLLLGLVAVVAAAAVVLIVNAASGGRLVEVFVRVRVK